MERIIREEKLKIPFRTWISTVGIIILLVVFLVSPPHPVVPVLFGLVLANQILQLYYRITTGYRLTLEGLEFFRGEKRLAYVPYTAMKEVARGRFLQLIKHEAVKNIANPAHIQAIPKLGGVPEMSMLIYEEDGATKVIQFQPTEPLHIFLEDKIKDNSK